jgi:hypothetical protein
MCGAESHSGFTPDRYVTPNNIKHAYEIIQASRPYFDWSRHDEVIKCAKVYFKNGEPFALSVGGASVQLDEMKCIRNRIAHGSDFCEKKFCELVRQKEGHHIHNMSPGKFLQERFPVANPRTLLQEYVETIRATSNLIVP